jgi:hypothetical protein
LSNYGVDNYILHQTEEENNKNIVLQPVLLKGYSILQTTTNLNYMGVVFILFNMGEKYEYF